MSEQPKVSPQAEPEIHGLPSAPGIEARTLSRNRIALSAATFLSAIRSEMITPLRLVFLVTAIQTPLPIAGFIEGVAQGGGGIARIVANRLTRNNKHPKWQVLLGYGISNGVQPLLAIVTSWPAALLITFLDTVGQGVRRNPLNALLESERSATHPSMGKAGGLHDYSRLLGGAVGALVSALLLLLLFSDLRAIFAWAAVPGLLAILALLWVRGNGRQTTDDAIRNTQYAIRSRITPAQFSALGVRFWMFTGISTIFALGNVSVGFFVLRLATLEQSLGVVLLAYFGHKLVAAILAPRLARLHRRWGPLPVLVTGYTGLGLLYLGWVFAAQTWLAWSLLLAYGIYVALVFGVGADVVMDIVPKDSSQEALDWYMGMTGLAAIPANVIAGWFWVTGGPGAPFVYATWVVGLAVALMVAWIPWLRRGYAA